MARRSGLSKSAVGRIWRKFDRKPHLIVVIGGFAWQAFWTVLADTGYAVPKPRPAFAHGAEVELPAADGTGE